MKKNKGTKESYHQFTNHFSKTPTNLSDLPFD